ncbi:MAG: hypothetical protein PHE61_06835 [Candidatus Omnitrophica bacterium]|nr:hypothetical protein [Candidatus Omnitrophota bacterium]
MPRGSIVPYVLYLYLLNLVLLEEVWFSGLAYSSRGRLLSSQFDLFLAGTLVLPQRGKTRSVTALRILDNRAAQGLHTPRYETNQAACLIVIARSGSDEAISEQ